MEVDQPRRSYTQDKYFVSNSTLEVDPRYMNGVNQASPLQPSANKEQYESTRSTSSRGRLPLGLSLFAYSALIAVISALLVGGIVGGAVGGTMSNKRYVPLSSRRRSRAKTPTKYFSVQVAPLQLHHPVQQRRPYWFRLVQAQPPVQHRPLSKSQTIQSSIPYWSIHCPIAVAVFSQNIPTRQS